MTLRPYLLAATLCISGVAFAQQPRSVSGIYPHLAMFNEEGECGTGGVVPWADRLWVITYGPHKPEGSSDKLYEITPELEQIIRPESIGGTPANRMIHRESGQLFIGPYAIDAKRNVRVIPYKSMYGRHTGLARHLSDPAEKIVFATMEEGIYEVDVKSLKPTTLWTDEQQKEGRKSELPGYHGKGFYSSQGRYIYANNGERGKAAQTIPETPSGVLAEWDGKADQWTVVRRNQFTEVTGPGGIEGSAPDAPVWSVGWDHRSLILMLLDGGKWHTFRLPKASHSYDGAHGWNTEWPRIREIGEKDLLMTMHGMFWKFPATFSAQNAAGIAPRSTYLKVIGDFCRWGDRLVMGCDDTAKNEFLNKHLLKGNVAEPGQSQSNLWFLKPEQLDSFGPALGRGAVWMNEDVPADSTSDPMLLSGFEKKALLISNHPHTKVASISIEIDDRGTGEWRVYKEMNVIGGGAFVDLSAERGQWVRLKTQVPAKLTAMFHFRNSDSRGDSAAPIFAGLGEGATTTGVLSARGGGFKTLRFVHGGVAYDLDADLALKKTDDSAGAEWTAKNAAIPASGLGEDAASGFYLDKNGVKWRLPVAASTKGGRVAREICTERNLLNAFGTFYEFPAENAGGFAKIRPVSTHGRAIHDYASYRGLVVMSGVATDAKNERIIRSDDGKCALWVGSVDDLWQFGKPRGRGGPWRDTAVKAGQPSDSYLCTGFDRKKLTLTTSAAAKVRIEADVTGTGIWAHVTTLATSAGKPENYEFPEAFGAYWLRFTSDTDATASALLEYD